MEVVKESKKEVYDVSIIVPMFNADEFLRECLDSLEKQTKDNIEIVIVDDGSTDKSLDIAKEYAEKNEDIAIATQENAGPGMVRKAGLQIAKGKYIGWCDADDLLEPQTMETLYNLMIENDADLSYCNLVMKPFQPKNKAIWFKEYKGKKDWMFLERNVQCTKFLTRKDLLDKVDGPRLFEVYGEYGWVAVLLFAKKIVYTTEPFYIYRVGHQSASGGSYEGKTDRFRGDSDRIGKLGELIRGTEYEKSHAEYFQYMHIYSQILLAIVASYNKDKEQYEYARKGLKDNNYQKNRYTKMILDYNHGKLKSFVLRNVIPFAYPVAVIVSRLAL